MFGFNVDNIFSTRTTVKALVFITCYHTTMALFIFEHLFCLPAKKIIPFVPFCLKLLYLYDFQACKYYLNYCSGGMLGCGRFRMWDVRDVECSRCSECGVFGMWDVWCRMFAGIWDVGLQNALSKNMISVASFTKAARKFCWIYRKVSWMNWVLLSLFDNNFSTFFTFNGAYNYLWRWVSISSLFWFNTNVTICVCHLVDPSKVVRYWPQNYFNKFFKRFMNIVDTWSDLCHHIKNSCALVFVNDFFILYISSRDNTLNQFVFLGFSRRTTWISQT